MNKNTSIYLDFVRFSAALLVFLHHFSYERISGKAFASLGRYGEDAVIVFFVLSGYVIAYVATEKEKTPRAYFLSRLTRLYSVVVPALLLTVLLDYIGRHVEPSLYDGWWYQDSHPWIRALASLSFTNQLWFFNIRFFSNGPYWSISYEFWYYVLFGIAIFQTGLKRWALLVAWALLVGPKILLLAPVWLLGVCVYHIDARCRLSARLGWLFFFGPIGLYVAYRHAELGSQLTLISDSLLQSYIDPAHLNKSRFFFHDHVVGLLVALNFLGAGTIARLGFLQLGKIERPVRYLAGYTFTLYLLHYPLLHCFAALVPWPPDDPRRNLALVISCLIGVVVIGTLFEKRKEPWKKALDFLWGSLRRIGVRERSTVQS